MDIRAVEEELRAVGEKIALFRWELNSLKEKRVIEELTERQKGVELDTALQLKAHIEKEIETLVHRKRTLEECLSGSKALRMAGINGPPRNREELLFVFGFLARRMGFEHVFIENARVDGRWRKKFSATLDGRAVVGIIERFGEPHDGLTVCWRKKSDVDKGNFIELEKYLMIQP